MSVRRVVLIGFMGAGKTAVGRSLARRLNWDFVDVDDLVEERTGRSIAEIFRLEGEAAFRLKEAEAATDALLRAGVVVAMGGGWAAEAGRLEDLPEDTLSIWLRVSPEEAVRRTKRDGATRPLLQAPDPLGRAAELLSSRSAFYDRADVGVDTEGRSVDDVTTRILEILHEYEFEIGAE